MVSLYSATHFFVDFACAFFMFGLIAGMPEGYICVLLYNFCAFAMQMPIGLVADKVNRNYLFAIAGCALVCIAYGLVFSPIFAVIVIGIGNAMFHIGGGVDVLNISEKKLGALGVFVSPGAFGIYYGAMLGRGSGFPAILAPSVLVIAAGLILVLHKKRGAYPQNAEFSLPHGSARLFIVPVACLFLVVCLRSYVGLALDFSWKGIGYLGTALTCAVVFGKTIGGFAADLWGLKRTMLFSLVSAALLFMLSGAPIAGVTAILLFNMTMPITLWAMARALQGAKGFAFGLLSFGLFLGFVPVHLDIRPPHGAPWPFALAAAISLALLLAGLRKAKT